MSVSDNKELFSCYFPPKSFFTLFKMEAAQEYLASIFPGNLEDSPEFQPDTSQLEWEKCLLTICYFIVISYIIQSSESLIII